MKCRKTVNLKEATIIESVQISDEVSIPITFKPVMGILYGETTPNWIGVDVSIGECIFEEQKVCDDYLEKNHRDKSWCAVETVNDTGTKFFIPLLESIRENAKVESSEEPGKEYSVNTEKYIPYISLGSTNIQSVSVKLFVDYLFDASNAEILILSGDDASDGIDDRGNKMMTFDTMGIDFLQPKEESPTHMVNSYQPFPSITKPNRPSTNFEQLLPRGNKPRNRAERRALKKAMK